ncbi:uncharacterized protein TRUGW13939_01152 [Talaromyces rugulosus]|uniref:Uncharacterized protein n=1 Tax=Talaromyces rugulosus TaxID=121627 RepID=A0A7H8QJF0_TALRU|nr:uncharacterized protein TRUGW13939_01152 [Talaromyces rugulosus]QKX54069.1 hypothetical protein TRUGW13939_01152 [Talaromyces rugulosus]
MLLGLPEPLPSLVAKRFAAAKEAGALIFSATHLAVLPAARVHYQLRYCPALSKKPQSIKQEKQKGPKIDPFENPSRELLVAEIPSLDDQDAGHILVLNKFPVIPRHFILATKRFRNQTDLLEKEDLEATFACIQAWKNQDSTRDEDEAKKNRLFAFFNSGEESGASQPHRHLQFLPIEDMREQQQDQGQDSKWIPLIDRVATADDAVITESGLRHLPSLPFRHFALPLPLTPSPETLYEGYLSLYRAAVEVSSTTLDSVEKAEKLAQSVGPAAISYNFAMTESAMMICPRRSEIAYLNNKNNNGTDTGKISLNGTILAGTLMVKQESEWDELRNEPEKINFLLADVGF